MAYRKTPVAARELGISYSQLIGLLRYEKIDPPGRDTSGDYVWTEADLERARQALAVMHRSKPDAARGSLKQRIARL